MAAKLRSGGVKGNFLPRLGFIAIVFAASFGVSMLLTQEARIPLNPDALSRAIGVYEFTWSPDAAELAFVSAQGGSSEIWIVDSNASAPRRITSDRLPKSDPQWSPDGEWIAYVAELTGGRGDLHGVRPDGGESAVFVGSPNDEREPRWSPDSRRLAFTSDFAGLPQLAVIYIDSGLIERPAETPASDPQWSPDGEWIAFVSDPLPNDNRRDNEDIFVVSTAGGPARLLTPGTQRYRDYAPSWSPDSSRLVIASEQKGYSNLYVIDVESGGRTPLSDLEVDQLTPQWSPDSATIAYVQNDGLEFHIWRVPSGGGSPVRVSDRPGTNGGFDRKDSSPHGHLAWSPDSRLITFTHSSPTRASDVWVANATGGRSSPLTNSMPLALQRESRFVTPEEFVYSSFDSEEISALVYRPRGAPANTRHPAILVFRDTLEGQSAVAWNPFVQSFVSDGYLVFSPNVRGSSGRGKDYRQAIFGRGGEMDIRDAFMGLDRLAGEGLIDADRVAVFGSGTGGFLASAALIRDESRFVAAVSLQGVIDLVTASSYPTMATWTRYMIGSTPIAAPLLFYERSLTNFVDTLRTPIIFFYGGSDPTAPFQQIEQFAVQAEAQGKWFDYRVFDGEPHGWHRWRPSSMRVALEATDALFENHLMGGNRPIRLTRNR